MANLASVIDGHPDDAVALVSRGRTTTYGQLREQVAALRGGLANLGLVPGDRIAISCANNGPFVRAYLAALGSGLVVVPLNPLSPAPELASELRSTSCRAIVVGPAARASFSNVNRTDIPDLESVIVTEGDPYPGGLLLDDLFASAPVPIVERADDDLAALLFTSGTAGSPKAAMLSHGNLLANIEQMQAYSGRAQNALDVVLGVLPLFHIFGLNVVLGLSLAVGCRVVLVERFDPASALETIIRHGVTVVGGAPPMWAAFVAMPGVDARSFEHVRIAASGAAKLPLEVAHAFEDKFGIVVSEGYGLTEASPVVTSAAGTASPPGSIGVPLPGVEVRLVDADGEDVLVGDAGEIWVRGPNVFKGYWQDEAATRAAVTPDGWLRTGDVAVVDDNGALYLVDRSKDLIIVSGFNVYPAEVETVLSEHPAVETCAVVGVSHPYSGEAVKAYVVVRPGEAVDEDVLIAFCAERLARYKCPEKVMFVDEIPRGVSGKVLRRELAEERA